MSMNVSSINRLSRKPVFQLPKSANNVHNISHECQQCIVNKQKIIDLETRISSLINEKNQSNQRLYHVCDGTNCEPNLFYETDLLYENE